MKKAIVRRAFLVLLCSVYALPGSGCLPLDRFNQAVLATHSEGSPNITYAW